MSLNKHRGWLPNDRVEQVQCPQEATTLEQSGVGAHPGWQEAVIREAEWTVFIQIKKENHSYVDCIVVQHMTEAKSGKKFTRNCKVRRWSGE